MHNSLELLLHSSAQAARSGRTAESWRIMHRFATEFWLADPVEPLGEYYAVRSAVADCLGMVDEAIIALRKMRDWAEKNDPPVALIARAHLAYQSLNNLDTEAGLPTELDPAEKMLEQLAEDLEGYPTEVEQHTAGRLVVAATTAYTVASNMTDTRMVPRFAQLVRRFGTKAPSEADRQLWFAQEHWVNGQREQARELAKNVALDFPDNIIARFESYDMQAHFDLIESLEGAEEKPGIAGHWIACTEIALTMGAPVIALRRAELACRALMSEGKLTQAADVARRMRDALQGAPICPALLELTAVNAEAAFELNDFSQALALAQGTAEWFELSGDIEQATQCYTIAALSSLQLGDDALELQNRRAELLVKLENFLSAAQAYLALALATDDINYLDTAWETLSEDPRHPDYLWMVAEAHLTCATVYSNVARWEQAEEAFHKAEELIDSLPHAEDLAEELEELRRRLS